jgi:outer membrane receptor protein involved in Fe transport
MAGAEDVVEEIVVEGSVLGSLRGVGSGSALGADEIALIRPTHAAEVFARFPGVWISRGSEQEHLTAIRSPVFTGPGSCGEFQVLENGIPIRPAGFCNVNNLFEVPIELASAVEVLRGAAGALFGGNAVHGVINVVSGDVARDAPIEISLEGGPYDYAQARLGGAVEGAGQRLGVAFLGTHANGYREATGHDEQKLVIGHDATVGRFDVHTTFSGTNLNQETGGFVVGYGAYEDSRRDDNPNPEAYRDAWSWRVASRWQTDLTEGTALEITPYARRSDMQFLQHFLPGQPLEKNGQTSAGVQVLGSGGDALAWRAGAVGEWAEGDLYEFQENPLSAARPAGVHYDYEVESLLAAGFYDLRWAFAEALALVHGGRVEWLGYDYDNLTTAGDAGIYSRPADRDDDFDNAAARLGLEWTPLPGTRLYGLVATAFRPPQATELYRLQSGQEVADLDSERVTSIELGLRRSTSALDYAVSAFAERSRDLVLRDANGFNVNGGRIDSRGVELEGLWNIDEQQRLSLTVSYARHEYAFDRTLAGGEVIEDGKDVDTAPRWLGSLQWRVSPVESLVSELEVVYQGEHYVNSENTADYPGHVVVNWRGSWQANDRFRLFARVVNLFDEEYADRADYAFGNYRYFPAMPLQLYAGFEVSL